MANLPVRGVNRVNTVLRIVLHMFFRICVIMLRLFVNKVTLAIVGALIIVGAIFAALRVAPPAKSIAGQVAATLAGGADGPVLDRPLAHVTPAAARLVI